MPPEDNYTRRGPIKRGASGNDAKWDDDNLGEVYFEYKPIGNYMRVNVIHAKTGFETFVLGPLNASHGDLKMIALRKLKVSLNNQKI